MTLASEHNLQFYLWLMKEVREHIKNDTFASWYPHMVTQLESKI
jgi:queuine tRNA-ribosyltransferase